MNRLTRLAVPLLCLAGAATSTVWAGDLVFSSSLPAEQAKRITQDLDAFQSYSFTEADPELIRIMALPDASMPSLMSWLKTRVHYIVEEDFGIFSSRLSIASAFYRYSQPGIYPIEEEPTFTPAVGSQVKLVMNNIGTNLYLTGKKSGALFAIEIDGVGKVPVKSPRIGLVQVGEGLFYTGFKDLRALPIDSRAFQAFRVATLFHEARHSDGNGASLGFSHAVCPKNHDYAGMTACDRNLNGPYQIEALLMRAMIRACHDCTQDELEAMKLTALNDKSRVITESSPLSEEGFQLPRIQSTDWDPTPEGSIF